MCQLACYFVILQVGGRGGSQRHLPLSDVQAAAQAGRCKPCSGGRVGAWPQRLGLWQAHTQVNDAGCSNSTDCALHPTAMWRFKTPSGAARVVAGEGGGELCALHSAAGIWASTHRCPWVQQHWCADPRFPVIPIRSAAGVVGPWDSADAFFASTHNDGSLSSPSTALVTWWLMQQFCTYLLLFVQLRARG
jgi:hypothetical protein